MLNCGGHIFRKLELRGSSRSRRRLQEAPPGRRSVAVGPVRALVGGRMAMREGARPSLLGKGCDEEAETDTPAAQATCTPASNPPRQCARTLRPYGRYVPNAPHTIPACSCPSFSLWRSGFLLTLCHLNNGTFRDWGPLALLDSPILDLRLLPLFTHGVS